MPQNALKIRKLQKSTKILKKMLTHQFSYGTINVRCDKEALKNKALQSK